MISKQAVLEIITAHVSIGGEYQAVVKEINALPSISDGWISQENHIEIYKWLLGYDDFPEREQGLGPYYWRTHLRRKLTELGIDISAQTK